MTKTDLKTTLLKIKDNRITTMLLPVVWLAVLCVIFGVATGGAFFDARSIRMMIDQTLIVATVATGASFIYATGNVNIAMGAMTGLVAALAMKTFEATESFALMFLVAIVAGVALGIIAVLISSKLRVKVLYVTVVMMTLLLAIHQTVIGNQTISIDTDNMEFIYLLQDYYVDYILFGLFFAACIVIFNFTKIGRAIRFIGTNSDCATATGMVTDKYLMIAFIIAGVGAGLGAILTIMRSGSVSNFTASTLNMDVLLAIVLGGMSVFGGSKSYVYSATLGALTVVVLNNGLQRMDVDSIWIQAVRGVFFLVLVVISQTRTGLLPEKD